MNPKELFTDDDAVSPVIGVILMVAITVILAAVIASFVLGLGQSSGQATPSITFNEDFNGSSLEVTVGSASDSVDAGEIFLRGDLNSGGIAVDTTFAGNGTDSDYAVNPSVNQNGTALTAGNSITLGGPGLAEQADSSYDVDIIWDNQEGDTSVLRELKGSDA